MCLYEASTTRSADTQVTGYMAPLLPNPHTRAPTPGVSAASSASTAPCSRAGRGAAGRERAAAVATAIPEIESGQMGLTSQRRGGARSVYVLRDGDHSGNMIVEREET